MPNEQPPALTDTARANAVFTNIVIDLIVRTLQINLQHLILVEAVTDGLTQAALRQDHRLQLLGPGFDLRPDRRSLRLPDGLPFFGGLVSHFIFDPIQLAKAPDKPD